MRIDRRISFIAFLVFLFIDVIIKFSIFQERQYINVPFFSKFEFLTKNYYLIYVLEILILFALIFFSVSKDKVIGEYRLINPFRQSIETYFSKLPRINFICILLITIYLGYEQFMLIKVCIKESEFNILNLIDLIFVFICFVIMLVFTFNIVRRSPLTSFGGSAIRIMGYYFFLKAIVVFVKVPLIYYDIEKLTMFLSSISYGLFFLELSRFLRRAERRSTRKLMMLTGYISSMISISYVLPVIVERATVMEKPHDFTIIQVAMIFAPIFFILPFLGKHEYKHLPVKIKEIV